HPPPSEAQDRASNDSAISYVAEASGVAPGPRPGLLNNESISQALLYNREFGRIFLSYGQIIDVYDESLSASVVRYHPTYDPFKDDDHLLPFGAVGGVLPGRTAEESIAFRDVIIRLTTAHRRWFWEDLAEGVAKITSIKISNDDLVGYGDPDGTNLVTYSLNQLHLEIFAQAALAVHQVLEGLYEFLDKKHSSRFPLDPSWKILRAMEEGYSRSTILMACTTMQLRLERAMKRIGIYVNSVKRVLGQESLDTLSSVESTRSSVRATYDQNYAGKEIAKLLIRPDYAERADDHSVARDAVVYAAKLDATEYRTDYYKPR
ncbi:hypothetical protein R3P38DRAFT_2425775, partial [Favolaschia claudopus]